MRTHGHGPLYLQVRSLVVQPPLEGEYIVCHAYKSLRTTTADAEIAEVDEIFTLQVACLDLLLLTSHLLPLASHLLPLASLFVTCISKLSTYNA